MTNRHERRRTKVFEMKMVRLADIKTSICAWDGCDASCPFNDMPKGWTYLVTYWASQPMVDVSSGPQNDTLRVPLRDILRDGVLCPEHTRALEDQLKNLGRELHQTPMGEA